MSQVIVIGILGLAAYAYFMTQEAQKLQAVIAAAVADAKSHVPVLLAPENSQGDVITIPAGSGAGAGLANVLLESAILELDKQDVSDVTNEVATAMVREALGFKLVRVDNAWYVVHKEGAVVRCLDFATGKLTVCGKLDGATGTDTAIEPPASVLIAGVAYSVTELVITYDSMKKSAAEIKSRPQPAPTTGEHVVNFSVRYDNSAAVNDAEAKDAVTLLLDGEPVGEAVVVPNGSAGAIRVDGIDVRGKAELAVATTSLKPVRVTAEYNGKNTWFDVASDQQLTLPQFKQAETGLLSVPGTYSVSNEDEVDDPDVEYSQLVVAKDGTPVQEIQGIVVQMIGGAGSFSVAPASVPGVWNVEGAHLSTTDTVAITPAPGSNAVLEGAQLEFRNRFGDVVARVALAGHASADVFSVTMADIIVG